MYGWVLLVGRFVPDGPGEYTTAYGPFVDRESASQYCDSKGYEKADDTNWIEILALNLPDGHIPPDDLGG
jgi:hypothetical protein